MTQSPHKPHDEATQVMEPEGGPVRLRKMCLAVAQGPSAGTWVTIDKDLFTVGKAPSCDLILPDPTVSRRHLCIERHGDAFVIRDMGSTNGTAVDGTWVKVAFLTPGARVTAGNVEMVFQPVYEAPGPDAPLASRFGSLVAASQSMKGIMGLLRKAAASRTTVLLRGETGVGKSALAKAIHAEGPRKAEPFMVFDCGSVAPTLIESELFGVTKGAYTGAIQARPGACELANHGTLFLDEIEELPLELQTKLLRVIEEKEIRRLGATKSTELDIQIIAACKVDLYKAAEQGRFRKDLYYRIAVIDVEVPALRDRREDIPLLCDHFLTESKGPHTWARLTPTLREQLESYSWPGNLRELRNVLDRLQAIGPDGLPVIAKPGLPPEEDPGSGLPLAFDLNRPFKEAKEELIDAFEREYLEKLLDRSGGRIAPAAREAGLNRKYFYDLLRKHGLQGRE